jgi:hypothetical protein
VHRIHRHERPTIDQTIDFLALTDDLVVLDKPSSIPVCVVFSFLDIVPSLTIEFVQVHPCGRYHHSSLTHILSTEYQIGRVYSTCFPRPLMSRSVLTRVSLCSLRADINRIDRLTSGLLLFGRSYACSLFLIVHDLISDRRLVRRWLRCSLCNSFRDSFAKCTWLVSVADFQSAIFSFIFFCLFFSWFGNPKSKQ